MTEYLYHVDTNNKVLGKVKRETAHKNKILHRSGLVLVFNKDGKLCLTKRPKTKSIFPESYDCACAYHTMYGETDEDAAKRELFEETKLKEKPKYLGQFLLDEDPDHLFVTAYILYTDKEIIPDPDEAITVEYYSIKDVDKIIQNEKTTNWLREAWKLYKAKERLL